MSSDAPRVGVGVEVRVPASSANLGPGFDSVGCALGVWDTCVATVSGSAGLVVRVSGEGAGAVPSDASHLVYRAMQAAWDELGVTPPSGLVLDCHNAVPHGRGMGSSATAIVTGIVAAQALHDVSRGASEPVDLEFANLLASRLEGHPDNASASVYGGATLSWSDGPGAGTTTVHLPVHPDIAPVVLAPDAQLSTAKARSVLPQQVRLADAAANSGRAALLVHALGSARSTRSRPPGTGSTRRRDDPRTPRRWPSSTPCARRGSRPSSRVPGRRCWCWRPGIGSPRRGRTRPHGWRVLTPGIPDHGARVRVVATG